MTYRDTTLHNGLRVIVVHQDFAPVVSVTMMMRLGMRDDPPDRAGMAHLLEHLTGDPDLADYRRRGGWGESGMVTGYTGFGHTGYGARVPTANLDAALFDFADLLRNEPRWDRQTGKGRRGVIAEFTAGILNRPFGLGQLCAWEVYWLGHTRCRSGADLERDAHAPSIAEMRRLFAERYRPDNAVLVLVGDVDPATAPQRVAARFGDAPSSALLPRQAAAPDSTRAAVHLTVIDPLAQAGRVDLVYRTVPGAAPGYAALVVLHDILLRQPGGLLSSHLVGTAKIATGVDSPEGFAFPGPTHPAAFGVGVALTRAMPAHAVERAVGEAVRQIATGLIDTRMVEAAKARLARRFVDATRGGGPDDLGYVLAVLASNHHPGRIHSWLGALDAVNVAAVVDAARRFFASAQVVVVTEPAAQPPHPPAR